MARLHPVASVALAWCLGHAPARAASFDTQIEGIASRSLQISERVGELEAEARPGAWLTPLEAADRFQEYLYQHLVGDNDAAAEGLYTLVHGDVLEDAGLQRDAEWYLGEALLGLGNYGLAEAQFRKVVADLDHPYRDDAVCRLLELYTRSGERAAFDALYQREIAGGRVPPTPFVTYSVAKGLYGQGLLDRAAAQFEQVPAGSAWHSRARYFLGTMAVVRDDLDLAEERFSEVAELPVTHPEDRKVHDLAVMALGRIHHHQGDYLGANRDYDRVAPGSDYRADKLYELIWTSIRRERWSEAATNAEVFLIAYPDHAYTAQLKLLLGHLNMRDQAWDDALVSYSAVAREYAPVRAWFATLAQSGSAADVEIREVLQDAQEGGTLPPYVVAMLRSDPVLARAVAVHGDLIAQRRAIEDSEALIEDLRAFFDQQGSVGPYEPLRLEAIERRGQIVRERLDLLGAQARLLAADPSLAQELADVETRRRQIEGPFALAEEHIEAARALLDDYERRVGGLRADALRMRRMGDEAATQIELLEQRLASAPQRGAGDAEDVRLALSSAQADQRAAQQRRIQLEAQIGLIPRPDVLAVVTPVVTDAAFTKISVLARRYAALQDRMTDPSQVPTFEQIASADVLLTDAYGRLGEVVTSVDQSEGRGIAELRQRFDAEVDRVATLRQEHDRTVGAARTVSAELTRRGFSTLEAFFAASLLKADMGIVDVYWAQKLGLADRLAELRVNKDERVVELERRFELIRHKMGDEP